MADRTSIKKVGRYGVRDENGNPTKYYQISQFAHEAAMMKKMRDEAIKAWARGDTTLYQEYMKKFNQLKAHSPMAGRKIMDDSDVARAKNLKDSQIWQEPTSEVYSTLEDNPTNLTPLERSSMEIDKIIGDHRGARNFTTGMLGIIPGNEEKANQMKIRNFIEDILTARVLQANPKKYQTQAVNSGEEKMKKIKGIIDDATYPLASREYQGEMYRKEYRDAQEAKKKTQAVNVNSDETSPKKASASIPSFRDMLKKKKGY